MIIFPLAGWLLACSADPPIGVSGAASAAVPLEVSVQAFEGEARVSTAATSVLVRQIQAGAPADLLLSASVEWGEQVDAIETASLLGNQLVVFSALVAPALHDLEAARCVAMGDPDHVPAGQYARAALESMGAWSDVAERVVPTADGPAAVQAVRRGACPVGIAYLTDVAASEVAVGPVLDVPTPIAYPLILLNERGRPLYDFLRSDAGMAPFLARGFSRP